MNNLSLENGISLVSGGLVNATSLGSMLGLKNNNSNGFQDTRDNTPVLVVIVLLLILVWVALIYSTYTLVGKNYRVLHTVMTGLLGGLYVICLWIYNGAVMKRSIKK